MRSGLVGGLLLGICLAASACNDAASPSAGGGGGAAGAGGPSGPGGVHAGGRTLRIAVIPKGTTHDFWKSVHAGAIDAAAEIPGVAVVWNGPDNEKDKEQQIKIVDTFINDRVDGICLAAIDRDALIEPVRQASIIRMPGDGHRLLFSNPASRKRENLTVRMSEDGGTTWKDSRAIHSGPAAYSCLAALPDGTIACLFEAGVNSPYERIQLVKFTRSWLESR